MHVCGKPFAVAASDDDADHGDVPPPHHPPHQQQRDDLGHIMLPLIHHQHSCAYEHIIIFYIDVHSFGARRSPRVDGDAAAAVAAVHNVNMCTSAAAAASAARITYMCSGCVEFVCVCVCFGHHIVSCSMTVYAFTLANTYMCIIVYWVYLMKYT